MVHASVTRASLRVLRKALGNLCDVDGGGKKKQTEKKKPETQNDMKLQTFFLVQPSFVWAVNELG